MTEANRSDDDLAFGEQLLGMQQFSAVRAEQYRRKSPIFLRIGSPPMIAG